MASDWCVKLKKKNKKIKKKPRDVDREREVF